jgi:hypothetical protein
VSIDFKISSEKGTYFDPSIVKKSVPYPIRESKQYIRNQEANINPIGWSCRVLLADLSKAAKQTVTAALDK